MYKEVYFLLDKNSDHISDLQDIVTNKFIYLSSLIIVIYWIYIYYYKKLSNMSIFIGSLSGVIFLVFHYFMKNPPMYSTIVEDKWLLYKSPVHDYIADFSKIDNNLKVKNFNTKSLGLLVNKEYIDEISKNQKIMTDVEYIKSNKLSENQTINKEKETRENMFNNIQQISFQVYTLITILFTILSLTWHSDKKLFYKLLQFFIYTIALTIPLVLSFFWIDNKQMYVDLIDLKQQVIFQGLSMTLAILTEIISLNSK